MSVTATIIEAIYPWLEKGFWLLEVILAFGILVAIHEFGHFISAKLTGMKVEEFALGFGKRLLGFKRGETEYSLRVVPLGGYCKIFGMDEELSVEGKSTPIEEVSEEEQARGFNRKPLWARFIVIIAGSLMNVLLAIVLIGAMGSFVGFNYSLIEDVEKGSPAEKAGIEPGDKIRIFAYQSHRGNIIESVMNASPAEGVLFRIEREDGTHHVRVHPELTTDENGELTKRIGIRFATEDNYSPIIARVMYDSPYQRAGLTRGDKIISINRNPVDEKTNLYNALLQSKDGQTELEIERDQKHYKFVIKDHLIYRTGIIGSTVQSGDGYAVRIDTVIMDTPAFYMGITKGMRITDVAGSPIDENFNWAVFESEYTENQLEITVTDSKAGSKPVTVPLSRVMLYPGIAFKANYVRVPAHQAFYEAGLQTKAFSLMIFDFLKSLFTKKVSVDDMAGPIGVVTMGYRMASEGLINLVFFFALISVNLGILNLMPIPGLDGGRAVFLIIEMVIRKPLIKARLENIIHFVGIILLFGLILYVTFNDVDRIINMFR